MRVLRDAFGRTLSYLRLSVTERCNFRCVYCLPSGGREIGGAPLSVEEIGRLVSGFARLGFEKVRVTGGEPTTRRDVCQIVERVAAVPGVVKVGLTTNGYRLAELARSLRAAGLTSINVSLDSLDRQRFARITGRDQLDAVVRGVEAALDAGIPAVKVNAVLMRSLQAYEIDRFLAWTELRPVTIRFIELMETGDNRDFFLEHHLGAEALGRELGERGWTARPRLAGDGPAVVYGRPGHAGQVGIIAPYSAGFCETCNRLRVSATGELRLCLFGRRRVPLRPYLQEDSDACRLKLERAVRQAVGEKPRSHALEAGRFGATASLAAIGG
ncbi:MAG TPA: GTP 3',8-cyclase MoaA [Anaeromyxobacteraceae bacterium]|nr:GTP 3',8-cyclase MoaA [Anaeromyxobacteraceae bacterium]